MYPAVTKGANGIFFVALLKTHIETIKNKIPIRHEKIKTKDVLKNPRLKARTPAIFTSAFPSPFVKNATAKNKVKNKMAQENFEIIFEGSIKKVKTIEMRKNPSVIEFGMRQERKSKNEMPSRYKRQRNCANMIKLFLIYTIHTYKKKKSSIF